MVVCVNEWVEEGEDGAVVREEMKRAERAVEAAGGSSTRSFWQIDTHAERRNKKHLAVPLLCVCVLLAGQLQRACRQCDSM